MKYLAALLLALTISASAKADTFSCSYDSTDPNVDLLSFVLRVGEATAQRKILAAAVEAGVPADLHAPSIVSCGNTNSLNIDFVLVRKFIIARLKQL